MSKVVSLLGQKFDRLEVTKLIEKTSGGQLTWECKCDCGNTTKVLGKNLKRGATRSCGCLHREIATITHTKHGHSKRGQVSRTYKSWRDMKERCNNPKNHAYKDYGGRGIQVCNSWLDEEVGFSNFLNDMGECPKGMSIDRKNNNGNYEPDNCHYTTPRNQNNNRRDNVIVDYEGDKLTLAQLADKYGIKYKVLHDRLNRYGMSLKDAIEKSDKLIEFNNQQKTISSWAREIKVERRTLSRRLERGWSIEDALTKPVRTPPKK